MYNRRLKDYFMTAATIVVRFDSDFRLAGYHRNLLKDGMSALEATKLVARALVRVIYRELTALTESDPQSPAAGAPQEGPRGVTAASASGDKQQLSNTRPGPGLTRASRGSGSGGPAERPYPPPQARSPGERGPNS